MQKELQREQLKELALQPAYGTKCSGSRRDVTNDWTKIAAYFIVVSTDKDTVIQCEFSERQVVFDFSPHFEVHEDNTLLKRLGRRRRRKWNWSTSVFDVLSILK